MRWVIARTARRRPTLMHTVDPRREGFALCGAELTGWSRSYFNAPIENLHCLRCYKSEQVLAKT